LTYTGEKWIQSNKKQSSDGLVRQVATSADSSQPSEDRFGEPMLLPWLSALSAQSMWQANHVDQGIDTVGLPFLSGRVV
jgi:hypothetical protein